LKTVKKITNNIDQDSKASAQNVWWCKGSTFPVYTDSHSEPNTSLVDRFNLCSSKALKKKGGGATKSNIVNHSKTS
jgi:hypothetical protein